MLLRPTRVGTGGGNLFYALFIGRPRGGAGKSERQLRRNLRLHGTDVVAKEARLYEKYGVDLNLVYISGGPRSIMSLIGGSVQFVNHSGMPALEPYQCSADTALIASPLKQLEHSLVVQNTIASAEQLRGKVLGMSTPGSLTDILLWEGLRLNGISEKDVTILPIGDLGARLSGLQTGRVHDVIIAGIQTLTPSKMGFKTLIDHSKLPLEIAGSGILVRRSYVGKNPDITIKFLKAWIEGLYLFKANPDFALNVKIRGDAGQRSAQYDLQTLQGKAHEQADADRESSQIDALFIVPIESGGGRRQRKASSKRASSTNWKAPASSKRRIRSTGSEDILLNS